MFCRPIKIQRFDTQTSKFTRPLANVLAPVIIVADLFAVWQDMAFTINKLGRNFKQGVQNCKRQLEMPVRVADFASCEVFAEWRQNVPKWAGNL